MSAEIMENNEKTKSKKGLIVLAVILVIICAAAIRLLPVWKDAGLIAEYADINRLRFNADLEFDEEYIKKQDDTGLIRFVELEGYEKKELTNINVDCQKDEDYLTVQINEINKPENNLAVMYICKHYSLIDCQKLAPSSEALVDFDTIKSLLGIDLSYYNRFAPQKVANQSQAAYFLLLMFASHKDNTYSYSFDGLNISLNIIPYELEPYIYITVETDNTEAAVNTIRDTAEKLKMSQSVNTYLDNYDLSGLKTIRAEIEFDSRYFDFPKEWNDEAYINELSSAFAE